MIRMEFLIGDKPLPPSCEEIVCNICKRRFAVPFGANLMVGPNRCEECNNALLAAKDANKNDSPAELRIALGE